jgi:hypothetical protein
VSESTERRHLNGKGPKTLSLHVLQENPWAVKPPIKKRTPKHRETQASLDSARKRLRVHESSKQGYPSSQLPDCEDTAEDALPLHNDIDTIIDESAAAFEPLDEPEEHGHVLSATRRSGRIATKIVQVHERRWGAGNQELIREDEKDNEPEDEEPVMYGEDEDEEVEEDDWQKLTSATPGQEGIPLWDWLGQCFLKMASEIGALYLSLTFSFLNPFIYPCR